MNDVQDNLASIDRLAGPIRVRSCWCCRGAARWDLIRPASIRRCTKLESSRTGSSAPRSAPSMRASSPAMRRKNRLSRLREFWKRMEQNPVWSFRDIFPGFNEKLSYWSTVTNGIPGFFRPNPLAHAGDSYPLGADQCRILFDHAAGADAHRTRRFRSGQSMLAAPNSRRRACPHQPDALFRQPRRRTRRQAHHGLGRTAAGIPGRSHRRRIILGRRDSIEHADGGGVRRQSAQELADLRRASLESVRRRADHDGGSAEPP